MSTDQPTNRVSVVLAGLTLLWVALVATSVPGVFTVDEASYTTSIVQLRQPGFAIPGTEGLTRSPELLFFDPTSRARPLPLLRLGSTAPPLYAVLAQPFSYFGFPGLIALNALAFVVSSLCVFWLADRRASDPRTAWLALGIYVVGGHTLEYAQGVWPQALSAALATAGFCLAVVARDEGGPLPAAMSGLVLGFAAGVRYQNIVFAAMVCAGLLLFGRRRRVAVSAFIASFSLPLLLCSYMNHERLGSWNPISKGPGYLSLGEERSATEVLLDAGHILAAKVVDYSLHPVPADPAIEVTRWWQRDPRTGATVFIGAVKKAWLQSSPWLALALVALALAWRPGTKENDERAHARRSDLKVAGAVVAATLASFAVAGFNRHDGLCFNQRYFLELVPLGAVAVAWFLEGRPFPGRRAALAAAVGGLLAAAILVMDVASVPRQLLTLKAPLVLALALLVAAFWPWARRKAPAAATIVLAACVGWAGAIHVAEDMNASRTLRSRKRQLAGYVGELLPKGPVAVLAGRGLAEAFAPLLLERDIVIADLWVDHGATAGRLVRELRARNRRVVLVPFSLPPAVVEGLSRAFGARALDRAAIPLLELDPPGAAASSPTPPTRRP